VFSVRYELNLYVASGKICKKVSLPRFNINSGIILLTLKVGCPERVCSWFSSSHVCNLDYVTTTSFYMVVNPSFCTIRFTL
jgi:hypothetical protein